MMPTTDAAPRAPVRCRLRRLYRRRYRPTTLAVLAIALGAAPYGSALAEPSGPDGDALVASAAAHAPGVAALPHADVAALAAGRAPVVSPTRTLIVRRGDNLSTLLARVGLSAAAVGRVMALGDEVHTLARLHPGERIAVRKDAAGRLVELRYAPGPLETLVVEARGARLTSRVERVRATPRTVLAAGSVTRALARAMRARDVPPDVIAEFARIFHWKVDFRRDIRSGTRFRVVYRKLVHGNHEIASGPIVAAELVLGDRALRAFRLVDDDGTARFFDEDGRSLEPSLLRTPVRYTRVSSPFSHNRLDPVVHVWRPHNGVDLAAPIGTPVKAAGDGVVSFVGAGGGYGKYVRIRHFGPYTTLYSHLSRFARHLRAGHRVRQGEVIGYVGSTGLSTGPHLLFEIRVNGRPRDPLTVPLPDARPVLPRLRARFQSLVAPLRAALEHPADGLSRAARMAAARGAGDEAAGSGAGSARDEALAGSPGTPSPSD